MRVAATDLDLWAATLDARSRLPQLIRRLILATNGFVSELEFRAGEGVGVPGWDGIVQAVQGTPFVPEGVSRWEMSAAEDIQGTAQSNYLKRTTEPLGADPINATFLFVTAHRWRDRNEWVNRRRSEGHWRDVRAYDADVLETWLEQAPAVHIWLSRQLGKQVADATDLETSWEDWSGVTNPPLSVDLVIGGRQSEASKILDWVVASPSLLSLRAETEQEAIAFLAAVISNLPQADKEKLFARSAVLTGEESWHLLSHSPGDLILVPQVTDRQGAPAAATRGNHVLVPFAQNQPADTTTVDLPPVDRAAATVALQKMGLGEASEELAGLAWRGLAILRRRLAVSPALMTPEWARLSDARRLLPAILAGRWDESKEADRDMLGGLAQTPYDQLREWMLASSQQPDAPVRRIGEVWHTVARADSWSLLAGFLTEPELHQFKELALQVLREIDPKFELPAEERYAAAVHGKVPAHSYDLRDGVSETIALLGAFEGVDGHMTGAQWAGWIVRETLLDAPWMLWASLTGQLPLLAEASPSDFMSAVERDLGGDGSVIKRLFEEENSLFSSSPSIGLIWALERLAWAPEHLRRSSLLLARVDETTRGAT